MDHLVRRFVFLAAAILAVLALGTTGFVVIEGYSPFDAFYMTVTTMTTVGYKEVHDLHPAGRVFNSFLILFGVTTMFLGIGLVTQSAIELELAQYFGRRKVKNMVEKLRNHYIVCGFGRVGRGAAEELLRAGAPFVVVDNEEERVTRAIRGGMLAVLADATRDDTLREVGIDRAKGLIATLASDADNLFVTLSAKTLNGNLQLCSRVAELETEQKMRRAGATHVFAPYNITGHRMAHALLRPHVSQFIEFATNDMGPDVGIEQVHIGSGSAFVNHTIAQMQVRRELGVIILAIRRVDGSMEFNPPADAMLSTGDYLIVMGEHDNLRKVERLVNPGEAR